MGHHAQVDPFGKLERRFWNDDLGSQTLRRGYFPTKIDLNNSKPDRERSLLRIRDMNETEDYPGPTHGHPDKQGQDPKGRADEGMVKPPAQPMPETGEEKAPHPRGN
jgi:hypothetical protein